MSFVPLRNDFKSDIMHVVRMPCNDGHYICSAGNKFKLGIAIKARIAEHYIFSDAEQVRCHYQSSKLESTNPDRQKFDEQAFALLTEAQLHLDSGSRKIDEYPDTDKFPTIYSLANRGKRIRHTDLKP